MAKSFLIFSRSRGFCFKFSTFYRPNIRCASNALSLNTPEEVDDKEIQYPPIKPRWPPGSWGNMSEKRCWEIWEKSNELKNPKKNLKQRFNLLSPEPELTWNFAAVQQYPKSFEYQQYITKTHMAPGMPEVYEQLEEQATAYLERIRPLVKDVILFENCFVDRTRIQSNSYKLKKITFPRTEQIINCLLSVLAPDFPHLASCQFAEDVFVRAFWDRYGIPGNPSISSIPKEEQFFHKMFSRFSTQFSCSQIRSKMPLVPFVTRDSPLCTDSEYSQFCYWPADLAQHKSKIKNTCIPGYFQGDPCQFSLMTLHCLSQFQSSLIKFGPEITYEFQKGLGLVSSFASTVAQAYFLGFSTFADLTYPLTTQTVITDGQKFSFFAYQLNTLELWKDDDGNNMNNICWHTKEENLYEIKDGQVVNFNDNVLKQLIKFCINEAKEPDYCLRPYLNYDPSINTYIEPKQQNDLVKIT
ncbi:39S ribosomal protein S30, mitochondrial-like [Argonauta hians]